MITMAHKSEPVFDPDQNQCDWPVAPKIVAHCSAIAWSSFAGMIGTATLAPGEAMLKAPPFLASASHVKPSQARRTDAGAHVRLVFADPAGEHQSIDSTDHQSKRGRLAPNPEREDFQRLVCTFRVALSQYPRVAAERARLTLVEREHSRLDRGGAGIDGEDHVGHGR